MSARGRIAIIGGGFAGVRCARTLRRQLTPERYEIVIFNRENHMVFHPLLAEVAGASVNPDAVAAPLRQMLPGVSCRTEPVQRIDLEHNTIEYESHDGDIRTLAYDHIVIACGGEVNLGMLPGMADHAFPLKSVGDAMALRSHVMQQLEKAEVSTDASRKRRYLSFIVVGGGYSGVEVAGEINDLVRGSVRFFQNISSEEIKVTIVHGRDQLLPEIGHDLREFTRTQMEKAGIIVKLNARVALATADGVRLDDGTIVDGATIVSTIGTTVSPVVARLDVPKESGRIVADHDMKLHGFQNAWAVGDCARIINAFNGTVSPPTGQFAERQGRQAAQNIVRTINGTSTRPFSFKPLGQLCAIGGRRAVAEFLGIRMSGFTAWVFWRGVYLFKLPSWSRRIKAGFDWAWELLFARDLAHLKTDPSSRVAGAFYASGDYVFREGEPGSNFYVIEKGEVEIVRQDGDTKTEEVLSVLGPGDFFGEMALIDHRPRSASVRARTSVEVVVMGKQVFSQVSGSLKPLQELFTTSIRRRTASAWQRWPAVQALLKQEPLTAFMEEGLPPTVTPESTLEEALTLLHRSSASFCGVVDEHQALRGILTRTDIFRASEGRADRYTPVRKFMASPLVASTEDSSLIAAATLRDHQLKWLPVVQNRSDNRLVGFLRADTMFLRALQKLTVAQHIEHTTPL